MAAALAHAPDIFLFSQLKLLEEVSKPLWIYRCITRVLVGAQWYALQQAGQLVMLNLQLFLPKKYMG